MLTFTGQAAVGRIMPKEAFYKNLTLSNQIRASFVTDIKRIVMEYKLSPDTINVAQGTAVSEILILALELKKAAMDYRIIENIARQNAHKLIFLIKYEGQGQLALYYSKLYKTDWMPLDDINLEVKGFDLDRVWDGFIEQIAFQNTGPIMQHTELSIDERLNKQDRINRLQKEIEKLERLSRSEIQPKKKFELYTRLQGLKKHLDEENS